jgi:hypothetical protein
MNAYNNFEILNNDEEKKRKICYTMHANLNYIIQIKKTNYTKPDCKCGPTCVQIPAIEWYGKERRRKSDQAAHGE